MRRNDGEQEEQKSLCHRIIFSHFQLNVVHLFSTIPLFTNIFNNNKYNYIMYTTRMLEYVFTCIYKYFCTRHRRHGVFVWQALFNVPNANK